MMHSFLAGQNLPLSDVSFESSKQDKHLNNLEKMCTVCYKNIK